jgi:hypothetical protein
LIEHENPELQRHALQCVSKIMVHNWEYVKWTLDSFFFVCRLYDQRSIYF